MRQAIILSGLVFSILLSACATPTEGPDKTVAGTMLGAAWGAGAGAVVGNQIDGSPVGEGAAVGAGFGAVSGAIGGLAYDSIEEDIIDQEKELASLRVQNNANAHQLARLQAKLDQAIVSDLNAGVYQVFFDADSTNIRSGGTANLEVIANSLKSRTHGYYVNVVGHTDDSGDVQYNERLAESRARTVSGYLSSRGLTTDQIKVASFGAKRPIASNNTEAGRQLNRRVDIYISSN